MEVECEVCGTKVRARRTAARIDVDGRTRFFCCEACRRTFFEHPDLYPGALGVAVVGRAETVLYGT